jgi:hypothetical protein
MNKDKDQLEEKPEEEARDNKSSFLDVKKEPIKITFSLVCMVEFFWIA